MTGVSRTHGKSVEAAVFEEAGSHERHGRHRNPTSLGIEAEDVFGSQQANDANGTDSCQIQKSAPSSNYHGTRDGQAHDRQRGLETDSLLVGTENDKEAKDKILRMSPAQIRELIASPDSLPVSPTVATPTVANGDVRKNSQGRRRSDTIDASSTADPKKNHLRYEFETPDRTNQMRHDMSTPGGPTAATIEEPDITASSRKKSEILSSPSLSRRNSSKASLSALDNMRSSRRNSRTTPKPLHFDNRKLDPRHMALDDPMPSPMPQTIPIPPYSFPTFLHLELSSHKPSALYIHRSRTSDFPYESSRVKMDRLRNIWGVWAILEWTLLFGFLACLDAWLYSFTVLPLRFFISIGILVQSVARNFYSELKFIACSLYSGPARLWRRRRASSATSSARPSISEMFSSTANTPQINGPLPQSPQFSFPPETDNPALEHPPSEPPRKRRKDGYRKHRRAKSMPSRLRPEHKADIVRGSLILVSCIFLMYFDASKMYHGIRGQAAIKLYVIYNVLDVCDRLLSALGQDLLECLISKEALERKPNGRSKVIEPFYLFAFALCYNVLHSMALFVQVITLNVAVNSYSNALSTLLMSAQFVEIKSTVFKKFEKENLFQLTCADIVERFQLWLMLAIIALRNLIEIGGLGSSPHSTAGSSSSSPVANHTAWPKSFTMLPELTRVFPEWAGVLWYLFQPMLLVFLTEMVVDNIKHAFITKFNNTKPAIYGRFHDILAKDYYSNAFAEQNLTRRLGLPVIPLSCLFIRASLQSYHMALATWLPPPIPSTATSLSVESATSDPTTTAALHHIDHLVRSLGRSTFGLASGPPISIFQPSTWLHTSWSMDDLIALATMIAIFILLFLTLLTIKIFLGMILLTWARKRYTGMKEREKESVHAEGRRVGGWGVVEVDEDKRRWIYMDDPEGARKSRERERMAREKDDGRAADNGAFDRVERYSMVAKRIW
ncbi:MAG: hypothetical protein LQ339_001602 [Xanthoria mediterranea]|nr:MAG: hypothetical protein LQ339_001602 [Xanthoria mediterranea]